MKWYRKILTKNKKEITRSAIISIAITFAFSVWYFFKGAAFEWRSISPISQPSLIYREFYSALVFVTIGAFLYYVVRLWQFLYFIFVEMLGSRELYKLVKSLVWLALILGMYFYIVPVVVDFLNGAISFLYNLVVLLVYLFPVFGLLAVTFISAYYVFKRVHLLQ